MADHPKGALAEALAACGVAPLSVDVSRDDLCQEDVLTLTSGQYSEASLARLADLCLSFGSRFVFPTDSLQQAFDQAVQNAPVMLRLMDGLKQERLNKIEAAGLSQFADFDPELEDLSTFAQRVEVACGFHRGRALSAHAGDTILVTAVGHESSQMDSFSLLLSLLEGAAPGVSILMTGEDTDEERP